MPKLYRYLSPFCHVASVLGLAGPLLAVAGAAHAADGEAQAWTFGGFGTAGVVHSTERNADYSAIPLNPGRAGYSRRWSADVDSRLGAQLTFHQGHWSAVVQVVAEHNLKNSYTPVIEWANIKYQATPELSLRLGRIALPLFLAADYRKASYALPWVRTPVELYAALPVSNSDGVDASYRWSAFGMRHETQVLAGRTRVDLSDDLQASATGLAGFSHTSRRGALSVRATAIKGELRMEIVPALIGALRQFGPAGESLARRYGTNEKRATVYSVGVNYDPGVWFLMAEGARINARSLLGDKTAGYVSGGYRMDELTPYAVVSRSVSNTPTAVHGLPPAAAAVEQGLNQLLSRIAVQDSISAGLRWDFVPAAAFKLQYDLVKPKDGTSGTLHNVQPGFRSGQRFGVTSIAVDFVF
jgi:hypothetical protein